MCFPPSPPPVAPPPPPPPPPPEPTPPSSSSANLPKAEAYVAAKTMRKTGRSIRPTLQIPLTGNSGTGVNTNQP